MKKIVRRSFINSAAGLTGLAGLSSMNYQWPDRSTAIDVDYQGVIKLKGKQGSRVKHWDILTIGNLSRNRYWGESEEVAFHSVICTCSVIRVDDYHIIVDPSLENNKAMADELKRRTGLTPDDIDVAFVTHPHGDHYAGLDNFPKARWLAGTEVAAELNKAGTLRKKIEPEDKSIFGVVDIISTPGHTPGHKSLRFDFEGLSVLIAGDSVATRDFWTDKKIYFKALDITEALTTCEKIDKIADIIVPGHDNYFLNIH